MYVSPFVLYIYFLCIQHKPPGLCSQQSSWQCASSWECEMLIMLTAVHHSCAWSIHCNLHDSSIISNIHHSNSSINSSHWNIQASNQPNLQKWMLTMRIFTITMKKKKILSTASGQPDNAQTGSTTVMHFLKDKELHVHLLVQSLNNHHTTKRDVIYCFAILGIAFLIQWCHPDSVA